METGGDPAAVVRARLDLAYDGTAFSGWASQPGLRTVQQTVEDALGTVVRCPEPPRLTVAGRTDAGVHARGQVVHADIPAELWRRLPGRSDRSPAASLVTRLNGVLSRESTPRGSSDVIVLGAEVAPEGFDARFAAIWRRYAYRIVDHPRHRDPLRRNEEMWHRRELDVEAMDEAASMLRGEHDFIAYCRPREGATTIRTLQEFGWSRCQAGDRRILVAHVRADAFCHSMVRSLVGASLAVGEGRKPVTWPRRVLEAAVRDPQVAVAPAHGLTLEEVGYPPVAELATRARTARRLRKPPGEAAASSDETGAPAAGCC